MRLSLIFVFISISIALKAQYFDEKMEKQDTVYQKLRASIQKEFKNALPGKFSPFVKGVDEDVVTTKKILALTFDACGGPHGSGYDEELINFLRKNKIPATLFLSGLWIDAHPDKVKELATDPLFEIENHGLTHHPCSIDGETKYGIEGTTSVGNAVDEIELNARKIEFMTSRKPIFYRSAMATTDEACSAISKHLGEIIISYEILSGDAVAGTPSSVIKENLLHNTKNGAIVIMHMNHPEWNGYEALREALPEWQQQGFTFIKLELHPLKGKH